MATRFIDKEYGADSSTAIANDTTGTRKVQNLPNATGLVYDMVDNTFKFNKNGTIATLGDSSSGLTAISGSNLALNTTSDNKPVLVNSRNYTQTSGDSIAMQSKPSQTITGTASVYGAQFSPRFQDAIGGGALVAVQGAPVLKGNTGNLSSDVRAFEASIDLNNVASGRTITGTVSALYAYLQSSSSTTYTGGCAVIHVAAEDTHKWDFLIKAQATNGFAVVGAGTYSTSDGYFLIQVGASTYRIPFFTGTD
jgi:hypothetical protein